MGMLTRVILLGLAGCGGGSFLSAASDAGWCCEPQPVYGNLVIGVIGGFDPFFPGDAAQWRDLDMAHESLVCAFAVSSFARIITLGDFLYSLVNQDELCKQAILHTALHGFKEATARNAKERAIFLRLALLPFGRAYLYWQQQIKFFANAAASGTKMSASIKLLEEALRPLTHQLEAGESSLEDGLRRFPKNALKIAGSGQHSAFCAFG